MSSHRIDRTRGARISEIKPPLSSSLGKGSPALGSMAVTTSRPQISARTSSKMEHSGEIVPNGTEREQLIVRPTSKSTRSLSNDDGARPSGLPRLTGNLPSYRRPSAPSLTTSRKDEPSTATDPTQSTMNQLKRSKDRPRNVLRRKANFRRQTDESATMLEQPAVEAIVSNHLPATSSSPQEIQHEYGIGIITPVQGLSRQDDPYDVVPHSSRTENPKPIGIGPVRQIPKEFIGLRTVINTSNLPPPPTPNFASASSPSTRYSESPGMWSSRGSTPTSLSSYSPGISQPATYRFKQQSPIHLRQAAGLRMTTTPVSQTDTEEPTILGPIATDNYPRIERIEVSSTAKDDEVLVPVTSLPCEKPPVIAPISQKPQDDVYDIPKHKADNAIVLENTSVLSHNLGLSVATNPHESSNSLRPRRPSRDGTDRLDQAISPVIRSNLPALRTKSHTRRASTDKVTSPEHLRVIPVRSAATSVESLQSNVSSRISSRTEVATQIPRKAPRTLIKPPKESKNTANAAPTNKFSLFSTRSKTNLSSPKNNAAEKPIRKGPAAGTGHEGYGRYATRGRKSSTSSGNGVRARSTSTSGGTSITSSKSSNRQEPDIDDFLLERLEPVVINGGGLDREQLFRTQSGQSLSTLSVTSASASSTLNSGPIMGGYSSESLSSSVEQSRPAPKRFNSETKLPSRNGNNQSAKPKITRNESAPAQISSPDSASGQGTSRASEESNFSALPVIRKEVSKSESITSTKTPKTKPSRRWNFFHRTQKTEPEQTTLKTDKTASTESQLHAQIATFPKTRPIAHYALLDADSDSLEDILHRVEESPPSDDDEAFVKALTNDLAGPGRHGASVLLPSPPVIWKEFGGESINTPQNRPASPKVFFQRADQNPEIEGKRRSRLAPVGRIPRVVSRRDRDHKPPAQSYSRPFSRDEAPSLTITASSEANHRDTNGRSKLNIETDSLLQGPFYTVPGSHGSFSAPVLGESARFMSSAYTTNEFLRFSPRKQSEVSSSTSEGDSILATVASMGLRPDTLVDEEDIWAEYDDLLDNMLAPNITTELKTENVGSFELVKKASKTLQAEISGSDVAPHGPIVSEAPVIADAISQNRLSDASVRLSRSKIAAALHSSVSPSPQVSYSELIAGYAERNKSLSDFVPINSPTEPSQDGSRPQSDKIQSPTPTNTPDFETTRRRNTMLFDMAERIRDGAAAQTNLRSASLMTSKWLSFGRVLFSPAHNRIQKSESERILILDGLGNDDWSYYCALTYPNANIFNLSIRSGSSSSSPHPDAWKPPQNHHLVHHTGGGAAFPFPKGFFSACVLRFPAASSEDGQRHILSESKRVLRSGGYLEMSVLDLDLVNMGSRTRKAVRGLKEKIYLADPDISLKPASDNIQRLLGICGYDNLNRCMVSIPVAGLIGGSMASSTSNHTSSDIPSAGTGTSSYPSLPTSSGSLPHARTPSDETEPSLGDLLSDPSPSASNDESITKVVARVGRWWYTRCYEIPVLSDPTTDQSIWAERRLLRECQKRGTGFRLLIAYAQKPSEKRRTVSL